MGKCCCAVGCSYRFYKGCGLHFYRFTVDTDRRNRLIAAVNRKDWQPTEYIWICNCHFVGGRKIDDPTSPAFISILFNHIKIPVKRKVECMLAKYERTCVSGKRPVQSLRTNEAASSLVSLSSTLKNINQESIIESELETICYSPLESHNHFGCSPLSENTEPAMEQTTVSVTTDMSIDSISRLVCECAKLREENIKLQSELQFLRKGNFLESPLKGVLSHWITFNRRYLELFLTLLLMYLMPDHQPYPFSSFFWC